MAPRTGGDVGGLLAVGLVRIYMKPDQMRSHLTAWRHWVDLSRMAPMESRSHYHELASDSAFRMMELLEQATSPETPAEAPESDATP